MSDAGPLRPALFIDRDGTLIADAHYLADATRVALLPTAIEAVRTANAARLPVVIVTNQSGIARGLITDAQYQAVRARTETLLQMAGAEVLATYHCPHWPEITGPCDCRKPGLGMYEQAARDHALDLAHSGYIGDRWRDVQPALVTGGVGVLVPGVETPARDVEAAKRHASPRVLMAEHVWDAVDQALRTLSREAHGARDSAPLHR
jgi:D-glycero-D-manno-heptose 1,7-bisphosphate phosphatase